MDIMEEYAKLGPTTPHIAKVNPASPYNMEDFYFVGGIPRVMQNMSSVLDLSVMTCTGKTVGENLKDYEYAYRKIWKLFGPWISPLVKMADWLCLEEI